jgi:predicted methyltransferase
MPAIFSADLPCCQPQADVVVIGVRLGFGGRRPDLMRQWRAFLSARSANAPAVELTGMMFAACARRIGTLAFAFFVPLCVDVAARAQPGPDYAALIAATDRSDKDREADKRRDPLPFLIFADVRPGMKVLDMGAGGGYSTELLARAVAPGGVVYGQNPAELPERPKTAFEARLKTPAMKDVIADIRPFDDPVPPDVHDLDLITFLFFYHDTTYLTVDRGEMNRKLFAALKPGGLLLIADHAAMPGQGISVGKTLHRIEESTLRQEIEAAGFRLVGEGSFWRNGDDTHDYPSFKPGMPVDNFVLKYQKPM